MGKKSSRNESSKHKLAAFTFVGKVPKHNISLVGNIKINRLMSMERDLEDKGATDKRYILLNF